MFERYTDRARQTVVESQHVARDLNHNYIGTEHLLLGILREGGGTGWQVLNDLGVTFDPTCEQILSIVGRGQTSPQGHIPFTPRAKKVLELGLREALQLGCNYVGQEHQLLGLIREGEGIACQALRSVLNAQDLGFVREAVIQRVGGYTKPERPAPIEALPDWRDLLGRQVRVWDGQGASVRAEGEVIAVMTSPSLIIRCDDGTHAHESTDLPIDWRRDEWRRTGR